MFKPFFIFQKKVSLLGQSLARSDHILTAETGGNMKGFAVDVLPLPLGTGLAEDLGDLLERERNMLA